MFNVTSAPGYMAGSAVLQGTCKYARVKTRHFYFAETRHLNFGPTPLMLILGTYGKALRNKGNGRCQRSSTPE
jgi:hypothetical protein